jgi:hypothetical protein
LATFGRVPEQETQPCTSPTVPGGSTRRPLWTPMATVVIPRACSHGRSRCGWHRWSACLCRGVLETARSSFRSPRHRHGRRSER